MEQCNKYTMKNKKNVIINMLTIYFLILRNINCDESNKNLSMYYKDKYLLFDLEDNTVEVYENMMIPYQTYISNVFTPPPRGNITQIYLNDETGMVEIVTDDNTVWSYQRFKLRHVEEKFIKENS